MAKRESMLTPAKRARFLRVLGETGNATVAARAAGVGRMVPYNLRRRDEWFARDWEAALAAAPMEAAAREAGELGWIRRAAHGRTQIATVRGNMWTARDDKAFLAALAQTGNVRASARAIGRNPAQAWQRRRSSAAFERAFEAAIADAGVRLEYGLIEYGNQLIDRAQACADGGADGAAAPEGGEIVTRADASFALQVVKWLDARSRGARRGNPAPEPDIEEVRAEVLRKVEAVAAHRRRQEAGPGAVAGGPERTQGSSGSPER